MVMFKEESRIPGPNDIAKALCEVFNFLLPRLGVGDLILMKGVSPTEVYDILVGEKPHLTPPGFKPFSKTHLALPTIKAYMVYAKTQDPNNLYFNIIKKNGGSPEHKLAPMQLIPFVIFDLPSSKQKKRLITKAAVRLAAEAATAKAVIPEINKDKPLVIRAKDGTPKYLPTFRIYINEHVGEILMVTTINKEFINRGMDGKSQHGKKRIMSCIHKCHKYLQTFPLEGKKSGIGSIKVLRRVEKKSD
jgi:hypothetical protein